MKIKDMTRAQLNAYHRKKQRGYREAVAALRLKLGIPSGSRFQFRPTKKTCKDCGKEFPYNNEFFYVNNKGYGVARCRPCYTKRNRAQAAARKYGMTLQEYEAAFIGMSCAICGEKERLVMDHCHELNAPRGILCSLCNTMLGMARDDVLILEAAIEYLRR